MFPITFFVALYRRDDEDLEYRLVGSKVATLDKGFRTPLLDNLVAEWNPEVGDVAQLIRLQPEARTPWVYRRAYYRWRHSEMSFS